MARVKTSELAEQKGVSEQCSDPKGGSSLVMNFIFILFITTLKSLQKKTNFFV
jgi:hypothetical protein